MTSVYRAGFGRAQGIEEESDSFAGDRVCCRNCFNSHSSGETEVGQAKALAWKYKARRRRQVPPGV